MGHQGVFGLLEGLEHGLLVAGQGRIGTGAGAGDARPHPTQVECRPGDAGPIRKVFVRPRAQARQVRGREAEVAGEGDLGKQVSDGHADQRRGGRQMALRHADVGAAAQQSSRGRRPATIRGSVGSAAGQRARRSGRRARGRSARPGGGWSAPPRPRSGAMVGQRRVELRLRRARCRVRCRGPPRAASLVRSTVCCWLHDVALRATASSACSPRSSK